MIDIFCGYGVSITEINYLIISYHFTNSILEFARQRIAVLAIFSTTSQHIMERVGHRGYRPMQRTLNTKLSIEFYSPF